MICIEINWIHDHKDQPKQCYVEINGSGYETRKIVIYENGSVHVIDSTRPGLGTVLSRFEWPTLHHPKGQVAVDEISQHAFEKLWSAHSP